MKKPISFINKVEENDNFNSNYTYINKLYELLECDYNELSIEEQFELKGDGSTGFMYSPVNPIYYNNFETFDNICTLGKYIVKNFNITNINDINRLYLKKDLSKITEIIKNWIKENSYPYSKFDKEDFLITFLIDCISCYTIYDIHKWLVKIYNNFQEIVNAPNASKELNNLILSINFMNLSEFLYSNDLRNYIQNLPKNYNPVDDYVIITKKIEMNINIETNISKFYTTVYRTIIGYISSIILIRNSELLITKQQPFYEPNKKQYRIIDNANSIMGIAYNTLLLNLTTKTSYTRVICKNPDCNNEFSKMNRREYCTNKFCQNLRNRIKSYNSYHNPERKSKPRQ